MGRSYSASFWPMYKDGLGRVFGHYGLPLQGALRSQFAKSTL
jgi:hypothetical protein